MNRSFEVGGVPQPRWSRSVEMRSNNRSSTLSSVYHRSCEPGSPGVGRIAQLPDVEICLRLFM
eukprot:2453074-Amphidinium_carterae.1